MKKIGYILTFVSSMFAIGTVGSIEQNVVSMEAGAIRLLICFALVLIGTKIIARCEEE